MAWALATAGHEAPAHFDAISAEAVRRGLGGFNEQDLSNTAWALATAGREAPELFDAISAEAARQGMNGFNEQNLSNTLWSFATAGHEAPALFEAISTEAVRRGMNGFNEQNLSNTVWAFATAGYEAPALFEAIAAEAVRRGLIGFNEQILCTMAWAFAVLDIRAADALFSTSFFTTRCAHLETSFALTDLIQLHQWSLWREERGALWPGLPTSLRHACLEAFVAEEGKPSRLQSDVVREIRSRGFNVEEEHRCKVSGYSIDALVNLKGGEQIAVEVDGPTHFLGNSQQPTGATLLKHRQLRYFGWRLESVPYWEWDRSKDLPWLPRKSR